MGLIRKPIKPGSIAVVLEGGMVSGIVTDDPSLLGLSVIVVDYDTDGADEDELSQVTNSYYDSKGTPQVYHVEARVSTEEIADSLLDMDELREKI